MQLQTWTIERIKQKAPSRAVCKSNNTEKNTKQIVHVQKVKENKGLKLSNKQSGDKCKPLRRSKRIQAREQLSGIDLRTEKTQTQNVNRDKKDFFLLY